MTLKVRKWRMTDWYPKWICTEVYQQTIGTRQEVVEEHNQLVDAYNILLTHQSSGGKSLWKRIHEFKVGKSYKDREGRKVDIIAETSCSHHSLIGICRNFYANYDKVFNYEKYTGACGDSRTVDRSRDLVVPEPKTRTLWINFYPNRSYYSYETKEAADKAAASDRIACKKVILTEGEFD